MAAYVSGAVRRAVLARLEEGEELPAALAALLDRLGIDLAVFTGLGGFSRARLAVLDRERGVYRYVDVEPREGHVLEVASLTGNSVRGPGGAHHPHVHAVVARSPGEVYAGHLLEARVSPFLELLVLELPAAGRAAEMLSARWERRPGAERL